MSTAQSASPPRSRARTSSTTEAMAKRRFEAPAREAVDRAVFEHPAFAPYRFELDLLTVEQWRDVLKVKARATVLELAAAGGWSSVSRFLWFIKGAADGALDDLLREEPGLLAEVRQRLLPP